MRVAHHRDQFFDMYEPYGVIEIFAAQRKTRVTGFDGLFDVGFEIILDVEINDFAARRHRITHHAVAQVEHVKNELTAKWSDIRGFFALLKNQPQFLLTVCKLAGANRFKPKHSVQKEIGGFIQEPDRRFK